jgi:hypothetical protein
MKIMNTQVKAAEIFAALKDGRALQPPENGKKKKMNLRRMCTVHSKYN